MRLFQAVRRVLAAVPLVVALARPGLALPSFAGQSGQPCAACHIGAFGPQLTPFGRDFKLYGYTATDGKPHFPPIAVGVQTSFTRTNADQPGGAARWFAPNNNFAFDQGSIYYAGRIAPNLGGFVELNFSGIARTASLNNMDIRFAKDFSVRDQDVVLGVTFNNQPSAQDLWNSTPTWGFPYNASGLSPTPMAATLIDGGLGHRTVGSGVYTLWNDTIYLETAVYAGLSRDTRTVLGELPNAGTDTIVGPIPYWRLALQKSFDKERHNVQIGTYGLHASLYPGGDGSASRTDSFTDIAFDANYQWISNPGSVVSNRLSAHMTWIHENQRLSANNPLNGTLRDGQLQTFRADMSYSIGATWTPTVQYFQTSGAPNPVYWSLLAPVPDSAGLIAELAYVPWGKPDSPWPWINMRLAAQYVAYTRFNGSSNRAADNNALFLSLWSAFRF